MQRNYDRTRLSLRARYRLAPPMRIAAAIASCALIASGLGPAETQAWEKRTFGRLSFEVPADWNALSVYSKTANFWYRGDMENPEASFSLVHTAEVEAILNGLNVESQLKVTVGGEAAVRYSVTSRDVKGKAVLIVFEEKDPEGATLVLVGTFSSNRAFSRYGPVFERIIASLRFHPTDSP